MRYDNYDRKGPKIFAGEYAAQSVQTVSPDNKNNWKCALSEAAFMTGLERNADVVNMASYAPLFAHVEGWQWTPNLIWFDNLNSYGTPDYYVQKLFSNNKGTDIIPITQNNKVIAGQDSIYASAVLDKRSNEIVLKIVNTDDSEQKMDIVIDGVSPSANSATVAVLKADALDDMNSLTEPVKIKPIDKQLPLTGKTISLSLAPYSVNVVRVKM
jgi:alpha-L-arabinofuranosidase